MSKSLDKLGDMLCDYGLAVSSKDFSVARGHCARLDVVRWYGTFGMAGAPAYEPKIEIDSWDKASDCAKYGFWLVRGGAAYGKYQAIAKSKGLPPPDDVVTVEEFKRLERG